MQKKFQVFVSSTYTDLIEERRDTLKSILDLGHIPSGMEGFFATDQEQLTYIKKIIDECDYYILIIAGRYGSIDNCGVSYTEREYDHAVSKGIAVLAFIHNDSSKLDSEKIDGDLDFIDRLSMFKSKVSQNRVIRYWSSREQLKADVIISLSKAIGDIPAIGWVRGDTAATEEILAKINDFRDEIERLQRENTRLSAALKPQISNIVPLSSKFLAHYTYYDDSGRYKEDSTIEMSWLEIFKGIGPSYFSPSGSVQIEWFLKKAIIAKSGRSRSLYLTDQDINTIKIQMVAYGFINIYSAQTVKGGMAEFMELTELGKKVLLEAVAVQTAIPGRST